MAFILDDFEACLTLLNMLRLIYSKLRKRICLQPFNTVSRFQGVALTQIWHFHYSCIAKLDCLFAHGFHTVLLPKKK